MAQCYHVKQKLHEITQTFLSLKIAQIPAWVLYIEGIRGCVIRECARSPYPEKKNKKSE